LKLLLHRKSQGILHPVHKNLLFCRTLAVQHSNTSYRHKHVQAELVRGRTALPALGPRPSGLTKNNFLDVAQCLPFSCSSALPDKETTYLRRWRATPHRQSSPQTTAIQLYYQWRCGGRQVAGHLEEGQSLRSMSQAKGRALAALGDCNVLKFGACR
jgi:hypothetical protein